MTLLGYVDEMDEYLAAYQTAARMPEPKRGGTWMYCRHCQFRTRRWRTYRTHWRRQHR